MTTIREQRVRDLLAFVAKHGETYHLRADFAQFNDITEAEGQEVAKRLQAQIAAEQAKLRGLMRQK